MTTATLPHVAADLDGTGHAWYAAAWDGSADDETNVVWLARPVLIPGHHWAADAQVKSPHVTLDAATIAETLFCSAVTTGAELDADELAAALDATLTAYSCHVERCAARHLTEFCEYPNEASARFDWCIRCISRALAVSV